ncbi:MAG: sulfotransferase family protein [Verrucomicrobia bacterium]|nr:MAG: sulfotransferase family protein [Verrucomicrobiota bacterium]
MSESTSPVRIAMWSGPRNISTAMMRSWGNRPDTFVCDEPFYAHYLQATGRGHPGAEEVIARGETDWRKVVEQLTGPVPDGKRVFYQKQMTHHLLPEIDRAWLLEVTNCFLIRDPREVIVSYIKKNNDPSLDDIGFVQQAEIFDWVRAERGSPSLVLDARDVIENPKKILELLCDKVGVEFTAAMLSWAPGLRATDGIWAKHWYGEVATSTTFRKPSGRDSEEVPARLREVYERAQECYARLHQYRLR